MKKYLTIMVLIFSTSAFGDLPDFKGKDAEGDGKKAAKWIEDGPI